METIYFEGLEYKEVKSDTGRIWLDRNLGAKRVAESRRDYEAFGNYYYHREIKIPEGYRIPYSSEWEKERYCWGISARNGAFKSPLKLPITGYYDSNIPKYVYGGGACYWSIKDLGPNIPNQMYYITSDAGFLTINLVHAYHVRLIKEKISK